MKNTDVFKDFDMVVSITEKSINDQLFHLLKMGTINPELVITQELNEDTDEYEFKVLDSIDDIQFNAKGNPPSATIAVEIKPQVSITGSGKVITFILEFTGGYAWFWKGMGQAAKLVKFNATGWKYAIAINLDLQRLKKENLENSIKVPGFVEEQLSNFMSNMFDVNHLFMNFQSTDLMKFDPAQTSAGEAKDQGIEQLVTFMNFYLKSLTKTGNPFILGYSIIQNDKTNVPDESKVPDNLKPVGTTFTMFRDNTHPQLSNLNFTLVTKGGHKEIRRSPDNFDTNWITPEDQCDGKMIYGASSFSEEFILKPLFEKLRDQTYDKLKANLTLGPKRSYSEAKQTTATGFKFNIADWNISSDIYNDSYEVNISNERGATYYDIKGVMFVYKGHTTNMGICTARASSETRIEWSARFTVTVEKDKKGQPSLTFKHKFKIDKQESSKGQNTCADMWSALNDIFNVFSSLFSFVSGGLSGSVVPAANLGSVIDNMDNSFNSAVMLPAGGVFFFKDPVADKAGNLSLSVTYKTDSEVKVATKNFQQQRQLLKSRSKTNLALMGTVLQPGVDA